MIYIPSWTTKKHKKNSFQATTFKAEENSRTFQGHPLKFKDFWRLCEPCEGIIQCRLNPFWNTSFGDRIRAQHQETTGNCGNNRRQNCCLKLLRQKNAQPSPLPSIQSWGVCCFLQVARTVAQTLHGGDGGGKALFSSFKVGYSSKSLFRAVSQLILSQLKIGSPTWIAWCNSTRHRSTYQLTTKYTTIPRRLGEYHGYKPRRFTSWYTYMRQES